MEHTRRDFIQLTLASAAITVAGCATGASVSPKTKAAQGDLNELSKQSGGTLGVYAFDTESGEAIGVNEQRMFGMCSSFKLLLAAIVLREADAGRLNLNELIAFSKADFVNHSPVTSALLGADGKGVATVEALARGTQLTSDNVAANLLLVRKFGGPEGFTNYMRSIGDNVTRVDRIEPQMNMVAVGDPRDSTTPMAMTQTVTRLLDQSLAKPLLSSASREKLIQWMIDTRTGMKRIRAGLPKDWRAGDKTGTGSWRGMPNRHNDVAVFWPTGRSADKPVIVTVFYEGVGYSEDMRPEDDAVHARVGEIVGRWVG